MKSTAIHTTIRCALICLIILASLGSTQAMAGAQSDADNTYISEQFGYRIDWQSPWHFIGSEAAAEFDHLILSDGVATAHVIFSRPGDTPLSEIAGFMIEGPDNRTFVPGTLATDDAGKPIQGDTPDRAWEAWLGNLSGDAVDGFIEFRYGEVRRLDDEIAVGLSIESSAVEFDGSVDRYSALLDDISQPFVSPETSPDAEGHARLALDPNVTEPDRQLIAEAVRLAEDFFRARFDAPLGADVTVTALPIPSPHDDYLIAATLGSSIVIYTRSLGWIDSPPAERIRTVIHEYTHAYQSSKTHEVPYESAAWFEEGVAEYLSLTALSDLGLMNPEAMEGLFGVVVTQTDLPPLQELERYEAMQAQPGESYPLMYFGVDFLLRDLPLSTVDNYYTYLEQGTPFDAAFESAYGITPELFYDEFARFRASSLPTTDHYPAELEITEGIDHPSAVNELAVPTFVIPGEQALIMAGVMPGSNCTLDLIVAETLVVIDDRETFANGLGRVFWLVTIPSDLPSGQGTFALDCGADPLTLPVLVS